MIYLFVSIRYAAYPINANPNNTNNTVIGNRISCPVGIVATGCIHVTPFASTMYGWFGILLKSIFPNLFCFSSIMYVPFFNFLINFSDIIDYALSGLLPPSQMNVSNLCNTFQYIRLSA